MYKTILLGTALTVGAAQGMANAQQGEKQEPVDPGKRCEALYRAPGHDPTRLPDAPECKPLRESLEVTVLFSDAIEQETFQLEMSLRSYCGTLQTTRNALGGDSSPEARAEFNQLRPNYEVERQRSLDHFQKAERMINSAFQELEGAVPFIVGVTEYQRGKKEVFRKLETARQTIGAVYCVLMPLPPLPPQYPQ